MLSLAYCSAIKTMPSSDEQAKALVASSLKKPRKSGETTGYLPWFAPIARSSLPRQVS
jgi:hypothetical protein